MEDKELAEKMYQLLLTIAEYMKTIEDVIYSYWGEETNISDKPSQ